MFIFQKKIKQLSYGFVGPFEVCPTNIHSFEKKAFLLLNFSENYRDYYLR